MKNLTNEKGILNRYEIPNTSNYGYFLQPCCRMQRRNGDEEIGKMDLKICPASIYSANYFWRKNSSTFLEFGYTNLPLAVNRYRDIENSGKNLIESIESGFENKGQRI